jgi:hypothetical protein
MGFRIRKTIRVLLGLKLNVSKSGRVNVDRGAWIVADVRPPRRALDDRISRKRHFVHNGEQVEVRGA